MFIDSLGKEVLEIKKNSAPTLVFLLNKSDSLNETTYLSKWIISDIDSSVGGVTDGMINLGLKENIIPDNYQLSIYRLKVSYDYKNNLERIADFTLKQKPQ